MEKTLKDESIIINVANTQYEIVKTVASELNWVQSTEDDENWDICWQDQALTAEKFAAMQLHQKVNHFPGMCTLSRKNNLSHNLSQMQKACPDDYDFFPETWNLPKDLFDLKNRAKFSLLIAKPESSCQGKGIVLVKKIEDLPERCVVQRYILKPFLIDNLKFDLRLYVLMAGCDPPRIFIHEEGLVRFATEEYKDPHLNLENYFMHLTNYAINKTNPKFQHEETSEFLGHKRSLTWLLCHLNKLGYDVPKLWLEICDIVIKTIISGVPYITHLYKSYHPEDFTNGMCFEILGFDVIIDQNLKPWVLEVNHTPSFTTDSEIDTKIKKMVISDAISLLNVNPHTRNSLNFSHKNRVKDRNLLKSYEYKKWKEKETAKWIFHRNIFEQQQKTKFRKIFPDNKQNNLKLLEISNFIYNKSTIPKVVPEQPEENVKVVVKKKNILPRLQKKFEELSKKKPLPVINMNFTQELKNFKANPAPKRISSKVEIKPKKGITSTGNFLIPKVLSYQGEQAPEENRSFMKWKLIRQNLIEL